MRTKPHNLTAPAHPPSTAPGALRSPMIKLPGGEFLMGDPAGRADEQPVHRVVVGPFAIARFPVTVAEYADFLDETGHDEPVDWMQPRFAAPDLPVCGVSWLDAVAYAAWLSDRTCQPFHLPTESQREYAARGGVEQQAYPWGDEPLPLEGEYERGLTGPVTGGPMPVGAGAAGANGFGLYHMADNVHEWCADWYEPRHYAQLAHALDEATGCDNDNSDNIINPRGPLTATDRRAARGGSWRHDIKFSRCAARSSLAPDKRFADFGFRLAMSDGFQYVE